MIVDLYIWEPDEMFERGTRLRKIDQIDIDEDSLSAVLYVPIVLNVDNAILYGVGMLGRTDKSAKRAVFRVRNFYNSKGYYRRYVLEGII